MVIPINKRQKETAQAQLKSENAVVKELEKQYQAALNDIETKIRIMESDDMTQSRIYRLEYQKTLKKQVEATLEKLHSDEYSTIKQFLSDSYIDAFVGTMYDLYGQGYPILIPIDKAAAAKAIVSDTKLSEDLYTALGIDIKKMKKTISNEITRGIASGQTHSEIARNIGFASNAPLSRAKTIARTESHRIQQASTYDAQKAAKAKGADIVKQWDSTLDGDTRPNHRHLDGQIREIDEPFTIGNLKAMFPGDFGRPEEDCNCRCSSLQRARKALDADELKTLEKRAAIFGLDKSENLKDFKNKYMKAAKTLENSGGNGIISSGAKSGALTSKNDPEFKKREAFADLYYEEVLGRKREYEIDAVAQNSGFSVSDVSKIFAHVFELEHLFADGSIHKFVPDYDMAQSWIRLREGKNIQPHDMILLQHELMEAEIMGTDTTIPYDPVHDEVSKKYNYKAALIKYLKDNGLE